MKRAELVFIPSTGAGHLASTVEIAKLLVERDHRLSITVLIMKLPLDSKTDAYTESLSSSSTKSIRFIHLPEDPVDQQHAPGPMDKLVEQQKGKVKEAVVQLTESYSASDSDSPRLAGFILDMFCTAMIDVANELGLPSYIYFTSNASFLGLMFHLQFLHDEHHFDTTELKISDTELSIPCFLNPVPAKVLPSVILHKDSVEIIFNMFRRYRETKGILVNTFWELESHALGSFSGDNNIPPVYHVGPIVKLKGESGTNSEIMTWLDDHPPSSVVFLCFGSMGSFDEDQIKEIAHALEKSGVRFLWSIRQSPPKGKIMPTDHENPTGVLPEGFLDRTAGIGKVIGWAPQVEVLAHKAIGGFVSHCGWNSTLESLWYGVTMAAWPLYAEQNINAFQMVVQLGLAVEIKLDFRKDFKEENKMILSAEEIKRGINKLMNLEGDDSVGVIRKRVKDMSDKSMKALMEGGSSSSSLKAFIDHVFDNM